MTWLLLTGAGLVAEMVVIVALGCSVTARDDRDDALQVPPGPAQDNFADAAPLTGSFQISGTNSFATAEKNENQHAQRIPNGFEGKKLPDPPAHTPVTDLADRLEKLSHRLRVEDANAVIARLAGGDKLDALLAGLLAGYIAGSK